MIRKADDRQEPTRRHEPTPQRRASWRGVLRLGLVTFPVRAINATRRDGRVRFHELHAGCHHRIHHERVCPIHGPVSNEEIVSGYEYDDDRYVEIDSEELSRLRPDREKTLRIDNFVKPDRIDPTYYSGRTYYLLPEENSEAYFVFHEALKRQGRYAVGQIFFANRDQMALLRPVDSVLQMSLLNYEQMLELPGEVAPDLEQSPISEADVQMAEALIRALAQRRFDYSEYSDEFNDRLRALIEARIRDRQIVQAPAPEEEPEVVSLGDALRRSLAQVQARRPDGRRHPTDRGPKRFS